MFTKSLILVLLGSSLILAHPLEDEPASEEAGKSGNKIWNFFKDLSNKITDAWNSRVQSVKQTVDEFRGKFSKGKELAKDVYEKLVKKGEEVAKKGAAAIEAEKQNWQKKIEEFKQTTKDVGLTLSYKIRDYQQQAKEAIDKKVKEAETAWQQWKEEAKQDLEKNNQKKQ